jgi:hypothetical protein
MKYQHFQILKGRITRCILLAGMLLISFAGHAQIELSSGIDMSYPLLFNSNNKLPNYGQISFGLKAGIAYKPEDVQFFPILNVSFGRTRLPLKQYTSSNVAALNFNYLNVMANENYVIQFSQSQLFIYGGIGFSLLSQQGLALAGPRGDAMKSSLDSTKNTNKVFPAMNLGFEYIYGESQGKDLYLSMGINFQYILLLQDRNTYSFSVNNPGVGVSSYTASLTGNVISPGFYIALHYIMHKRKSGMYM